MVTFGTVETAAGTLRTTGLADWSSVRARTPKPEPTSAAANTVAPTTFSAV